MTRRTPGTSVEASPDFPVLDTLRAVGALAVVTTHVAFQTGDYVRHGIVGSLLSRLDVGVAVFFVLSGFLLSRPWFARAATGRPHPPVGRYYWKRLVRIYPVYAVCVVLALVLVPQDGGGRGPLVWLRALTLTDVFVGGRLPQGLTQMWSLAVEVTFYLVLPLLMALMLGRGAGRRPDPPAGQGGTDRRVLVVLALGLLLSCWWNLALAGQVEGLTSGAPLLWLPAHLTWFLVGIAIALVHVRVQQGAPSRAVRGVAALGALPGVCWTLVGGLVLVAATPLGGPILLLVATPTQSLVKHLTYAAIAGLVVLCGVFAPRNGRYAAALSHPWLRHLGRISYSTFCVHLVVLALVRAALGHELFSPDGVRIWVLTVGVSLLASELLYRCVEKPGMRLKDLGSRRRTASVAGRAATAESAATTK